jgi:acetyltransferase-like isoleucine patch superfamily enzyme
LSLGHDAPPKERCATPPNSLGREGYIEMTPLGHLVERLIRHLKQDPDYRLSPELTARELVIVLWGRGWAFLRGLWWRPRLRSCAGPFFVGRRVVIRHPHKFSVGRSVTLEDDVRIDALSRHGIRLGNNVNVAKFTVIETTGVISNLGEGFEMGDNSNLGDFCFVGAGGGVRIGNNVLIGQRVSFHSENHRFERTDIPIKEQGVTRQGIVVEDDCWIGAGSIILAGVTIGHGSIIGAGSVVTRSVPPMSVAAGVPAKILRQRGEGEAIIPV